MTVVRCYDRSRVRTGEGMQPPPRAASCVCVLGDVDDVNS